jgi:hypothetical protein
MTQTVLTALALALTVLGCASKPRLREITPADSLQIVEDNLAHRASMDEFFRLDAASPFHRDTAAAYHGIRWFPIDPRYRTESILHRYDHPDTVDVLGTKGERRRQLRYGYFEVTIPDDRNAPVVLQLTAYRFTPSDSMRYRLYRNNLSVWFTDETTGKETYGVGRYLDVGDENPDTGHLYSIDFNRAYNPYCAYSPLYSCAVPRKEDHLPLALRVGEMKYHE